MMGFSALLAGDLSTLQRPPLKEPAYTSKPRYCLIVVGQEAETKIWMVEDGPIIYVDCNGNGDVTEKGEKFNVAHKEVFNTIDEGKSAPYRTHKYEISNLVAGKTTHTEVRL